MSETPVLKELKPLAGAPDLLYTGPASGAGGTVFCMNLGQDTDQISVALLQNGDTLGNQSWICNNTYLYPGHSLYLQQIYIGSDDEIWVSSSLGTTNFIFTGHEF